LHRSQKCCTIGITKLIKKLPSIALQQAAGAYKDSPFSWFNKELLLALRPDLIGCPPLNGSAA
jgi:hypothetical protein